MSINQKIETKNTLLDVSVELLPKEFPVNFNNAIIIKIHKNRICLNIKYIHIFLFQNLTHFSATTQSRKKSHEKGKEFIISWYFAKDLQSLIYLKVISLDLPS